MSETEDMVGELYQEQNNAYYKAGVEFERERIIKEIKEAFGEHTELAHTYGNICSCEIIETFVEKNNQNPLSTIRITCGVNNCPCERENK